jgi:hypothetical protein
MGDRARLGSLVRPGALVALGVLITNDHLLKGSGLLPGWLTGKLSDFAGLYLFPILVFGLFGHARVVGIATALGFLSVKLVPAVNGFVASAWGPMRMDPTDLVALPMVWLAVRGLERGAPHPGSLGFRIAVTLASVAACIATSQPLTRGYPEWKLEAGKQHIGCARLEVWVSKSGKEGVGVNVQVDSTGAERCHVEILSATLDVGGEKVSLATRPRAENLGEVPVIWYLPFAFDNEKAWNEERRSGTLSLDVMTSGGAGRLETRMKHEWGSPHVMRRRFTPDAGSPYALPPRSDQAYELEPKDAGAIE